MARASPNACTADLNDWAFLKQSFPRDAKRPPATGETELETTTTETSRGLQFPPSFLWPRHLGPPDRKS